MAAKNVNPENPYVFNEFFFADQNPLQYNGSVYSVVHRTLNTLVQLLGISTSLLVVYLVIFKTPTYFRSFSRMLCLCAIMDVVISTFDLMCQLRFQLKKEAILTSFTGPGSLLSYRNQCILLSVKMAAYIQIYLVLPFQYIFRYQTIKRNSPPSFLFIFAYILICCAVSICGFLLGERAFCTFDNPNKIDFGQYWYKEAKIPVLLIGPTAYPPTWHQTIFFMSTTWFSFCVAILFARLTVKELKKQSINMSARTISLQRQLGRALFAQCLIPIFTIIIPTVFAQANLEFGLQTGYFTDIQLALMMFYPLLNSLCTLFYIPHYRQFCSRLFCSCNRFKSPVQPISHTNINNSNSITLRRVEAF